jgi:hypothetical protein
MFLKKKRRRNKSWVFDTRSGQNKDARIFMLLKGKNEFSPRRKWALLWLDTQLGTGTGVNESGHAAEEEGEHVQVGEAGKINKLTRVRGGGRMLPEAEISGRDERGRPIGRSGGPHTL